MSQDIFISYSSKDKEKANRLSELLASAGLSVWIDRSSLDVATSWSAEIVDAINACSAFIVLLSQNSVESHNVIKEVSLASEKQKKILPLDLEPIALPRELEYQLAGIHRAPMTDIDSIIRALGKLGLEATQAPTLKRVIETDLRKSLMILPFEDLSPTADNQWFADGIVSEMISSLTYVKSLRLIDAQTTKEFKSYKGQLSVYAKEMGIRYFVQGDVRKFGDQIKISSRLLDIETGDHLWQDSLKGTMEDIFTIQETVAKKVVDGLHIILTKDEEKGVEKRSTENAEAYELSMKAQQYFNRHTHADFERALGLLEEAVRLDPLFAEAHMNIAAISLAYYRTYSRDNKWIKKASASIANAESILGQSKQILSLRSDFALNTGNVDEALQLAERAAELFPDYSSAFDMLGFVYYALGRSGDVARARERYLELMPDNRAAHFNYMLALNELKNFSRLSEAAHIAKPLYERYLRLTPDDLHARVHYATILGWSGEHEMALLEARKLETMGELDGIAFYNLACLYLHEGDRESGLRTLEKSIRNGFRTIENLRKDPDLDTLRDLSGFDSLINTLEEMIENEKKS